MMHAGCNDPENFGPYSVIRKIATGGMAEVFLCRLDSAHGFSKQLAVKAINHDLSGEESFRELFAGEARLASSLSHPNVVSVFDFGQESGRCYLVMEYIDGCSLSEIALRLRDGAMRIPLSVWRHWMESILAGIGYLHARGIIHRDVSPGNVLFTRTGAIKITDLGISRRSGTNPGGSNSVDGKIPYLSPEALEGNGGTPRSDLYSAVLIGAELLLGRPVFPQVSLEEARRLRLGFDPNFLLASRQAISPEIAGIVGKGLAFRPEGRFQDADSLCMAIETAIPFRATRSEAEAFWNSLFPERSEAMTELDLETGGLSPVLDGNPAIVRERRQTYGPGIRGAAIGIAAVVSIAAGGSYLHGRLRIATHGKEAAVDRNDASGGSAKPEVVREKSDVRVPSAQEDGSRALGYAPSGSRKPAVKGSTTPIARESAGAPQNAPVDARISDSPTRSAPVRTGVIPVIQAIPWAKVYDGTRYLGDTPIREVGLPVGEHRLRFINEPLGAERIVTLTVWEATNPKVIVTLVGSRTGD